MSGKFKMFSLAIMLGAATMMTACGESNKSLENDYVSISQYTGFEISDAGITKATDENVESRIQSILESDECRIETEVTEDRPCQRGDVVYIDYEGKIDGVAFDGGTAKNQDLELGSGTFIDGFEDAVIGHSKGETFDIDVTFPEDYQSSDLAGKPAVFTITINKIVTVETPELTDDFVASVSDVATTVEEYQELVKQTIQDEYTEELSKVAFEKVVDATNVKEFPEDRLTDLENQLVETYQNLAKDYNMEYADFLAAIGYSDEAKFNEAVETAAKKSLTQTLIIEAISEQEGIVVDSEDEKYNERVMDLAKKYGYEDTQAFYNAAGKENIEESILGDLVKEWICSNCKVASE